MRKSNPDMEAYRDWQSRSFRPWMSTTKAFQKGLVSRSSIKNHYKMQAYGPERSLRKLIDIEAVFVAPNRGKENILFQ